MQKLRISFFREINNYRPRFISMKLSLSGLFEKLEKQYQKGLPFVVYKHPEEQNLNALFQKDKTLHTTYNFSQSGFVFAPFDYQDLSYLIPRENLFTAAYQKTDIQKIKNGLTLDQSKKHVHRLLLREALDCIAKDEAKKIVLAHKFCFSKIKIHPLQSFENLLQKYPRAFCYLWFHPTLGLWMGATPELLCRTDKNHFSTVALAGTIFKDKTKNAFTQKEFEEQNWVTKGIVNQLNNLSEKLTVGALQEIAQGSLLHLCNRLQGILKKPYTLKHLIQKLHPTAAVCGYPTQRAKNFILKNEGFDRTFYTGFLGEINNEKKQNRLYVNIRCLEYKDENLFIYAGGGITKQSIPSKEWAEVCQKGKIILDILV